jgi:hypothetical protein
MYAGSVEALTVLTRVWLERVGAKDGKGTNISLHFAINVHFGGRDTKCHIRTTSRSACRNISTCDVVVE